MGGYGWRERAVATRSVDLLNSMIHYPDDMATSNELLKLKKWMTAKEGGSVIQIF